EREKLPRCPERHLEQGEGHDRHRDRLLADEALRPPEDAGPIDRARRGEGPDEDARQDERDDEKPERPVEEPDAATRRGSGHGLLRFRRLHGLRGYSPPLVVGQRLISARTTLPPRARRRAVRPQGASPI